jgi:hypothetical protein
MSDSDVARQYLFRLPTPGEVPAGLVVVHNKARPTRHLSAYGFRVWLQPRDPLVERCPCAWASELGDHYRTKGRAPRRGPNAWLKRKPKR